jgi:type III restriction enzyme
MIHHYYPDFLVRCTNSDTYIAETKADDQVESPNAERKVAALAWCDRINALPPEHRSNSIWHYVLLGEDLFYS